MTQLENKLNSKFTWVEKNIKKLFIEEILWQRIFWICKDISWAAGSWTYSWLFGIISVTLSACNLINSLVFWYKFGDDGIIRGDTLHEFTELMWLSGNFYWMIGETHDIKYEDVVDVDKWYEKHRFVTQIITTSVFIIIFIWYSVRTIIHLKHTDIKSNSCTVLFCRIFDMPVDQSFIPIDIVIKYSNPKLKPISFGFFLDMLGYKDDSIELKLSQLESGQIHIYSSSDNSSNQGNSRLIKFLYSYIIFPTWNHYENFHIFLWMGKDLGWNMLNKTMWLIFTPITLFVSFHQVYITSPLVANSKNEHYNPIDHVNMMSNLIWVSGNAYWAIGDLWGLDTVAQPYLFNPNRMNTRWISMLILIFAFTPFIFYFIYMLINNIFCKLTLLIKKIQSKIIIPKIYPSS